MNKEEAKKQIDADDASINGVKLITTRRAKEIIDAIDDHPKVKLPREVGEELDAWQKNNPGATFGHYMDCVTYEADGLDDTYAWYQGDKLAILVDACRYGWEAEPEAKWYVQTPKEWWEDSDIPEWMHFDTCRGVCSGFSKLGRTAFTSAELKQYHLDSDIFTLVPVGEEK